MQLVLKYFLCFSLISRVFCDNQQEINNVTGNSLTDNKDDILESELTEYSSTTTAGSVQNLKKLTKKRCSREYNANCLKVDLISSIDKLSKNTDFSILPGIRVVSNPDVFASQKTTDLKMVFSVDNVNEQLNELLLRRVANYAKSLSLNVQVFDKDQKKGKSLGSNLLDNLIRSFTTVEGRGEKKKGNWGSILLTAAVLTGGTLLWMGLSSLMAMATKALAAALLSIVISCITAYKASSGGGSHHQKSATYEILAKPVYSHAYTAELQHDPHSAAATGHQYGRNMEWDKMTSMSSRSEIQVPIRDDVHQLAYQAHVRPIFKRRAV